MADGSRGLKEVFFFFEVTGLKAVLESEVV